MLFWAAAKRNAHEQKIIFRALVIIVAIALMKKFITFFNLPSNTEIFPKQKKLRAGDAGNWINLPYFGLGEAFDGNMKSGLEDQTGRILDIEDPSCNNCFFTIIKDHDLLTNMKVKLS